jgi:hypothetical protein
MRFGCLLAVALLAALTSPVQATVLHVPSQYPTIQDGVDAAVAGDTVMVAAGTYSDLVSTPPDTTRTVVDMKTGVTLLGAGMGQSIIDPQLLGRGIYCNDVTSGHIEGFTIQNAFAEVKGAGILCVNGSSPTITHCEITDNEDGGIILDGLDAPSNPDITFCQITGNVGKQGGGLLVEDNCDFYVGDCTINGNEAPEGGGIYIRNNCDATIERCAVNENILNSNGAGGGIALLNAHMTLTDSEVNDNQGQGNGGGIFVEDQATATIENTLIQDNVATFENGSGGGIYVSFSDVDLTRCTITGNEVQGSAGDGGGVYIFFTTNTTLTECTIADNTNPTSADDGAIYLLFASPIIQSSIVALNQGGKGIHCGDDSTPQIGCSDFFGNSGGDQLCGTDLGDNFSQDPLFCDAAAGDFTLDRESPCLDNQHPTGALCGPIGALGLGPCNAIGVPDQLGNAVQPPMPFYASPNPFFGASTIHFGLAQPGNVWLVIYDVGGRQVRVLADGHFAAGEHHRSWDARDHAGQMVPCGVYFYQLGGDVPQQTGRIVLAR